jgi:hypothetical protein
MEEGNGTEFKATGRQTLMIATRRDESSQQRVGLFAPDSVGLFGRAPRQYGPWHPSERMSCRELFKKRSAIRARSMGSTWTLTP